MNCPNCGSDCWDNTAKVAGGWKGPLHKCKDKTCDWVMWPPKPDKKKAPPANGVAHGPKWGSWRELAETYHESLLIARKQVLALELATKKPASMADILSAGATVFITAARDGVKGAPVQQPLDEVPAALQQSDEEDGIPF